MARKELARKLWEAWAGVCRGGNHFEDEGFNRAPWDAVAFAARRYFKKQEKEIKRLCREQEEGVKKIRKEAREAAEHNEFQRGF